MDAKEIGELEKLRFEYAWRFFDFHAKQRITMFNFFVVLVPFLCGGYFFNLKTDGGLYGQALFSFVIAMLGLALTGTFHLFDLRNRQLYQISQKNLRLIERGYLYRPGVHPLMDAKDRVEFPGIVISEEEKYGNVSLCNLVVKHGFLIGTIHLLSGIFFGALAVYALGLHRHWF